MSQMSQTRQDSSAWSRWVLAAVVLLLVVAVVAIRHRHKDPAARTVRFAVPPADRINPDAASAGGLADVPAGQLMTLDPTRRFLVNSTGKTADAKTPSANKPVFITGDSGWSLQVQLSDADIQFYLELIEHRGALTRCGWAWQTTHFRITRLRTFTATCLSMAQTSQTRIRNIGRAWIRRFRGRSRARNHDSG